MSLILLIRHLSQKLKLEEDNMAEPTFLPRPVPGPRPILVPVPKHPKIVPKPILAI